MSLLTTTQTTAQVESVVRRNVISRFGRDTGLVKYGTATGGGTTTIVDTTSLKSSQFNADNFSTGWARISYDAGGAAAAPETEIRDISAAFAPSTGTVTTTAFSAAVASGDKYELWGFVHPQTVLDTIDQVLTQDCYIPDWTLLTEVPDGDMEQSGTTDWTNSNATLSKATAEPQMWGRRYLNVLTTAAGGYATLATNIRVVPGRRYHFSTLVRCATASTTASLVIYDISNSAAISTKTTTSTVNVRLRTDFTAPVGCNFINIRAGSDEDAKNTCWAQMCLFSPESRDLPLPWWVREKQQVKAVMTCTFDSAGSSDLYQSVPRLSVDTGRWDVMDKAFGRGQLSVVSRHGPPSEPVMIMGTRNETAFDNDNTEVKRVDANWLAACLNYRVFDQLQSLPNSSLLSMSWVNQRMQKFERDYEMQRKKQAQRAETALLAQQNDVLLYAQTPYETRAPRVN